MKQALLLYELESPALLDLLDDERFAYGDNGGVPDGNVLLPGPDGVDAEVARRVVEAGYGDMVRIVEETDAGMALLFGWNIVSFTQWFDYDRVGVAEVMGEIATGRGLGWAHYGAYGTEDSTWVYVQKGGHDA